MSGDVSHQNPIGGVGEFSLIAGIRQRMEGKYPLEVVRGIGDDCAVLRQPGGMDWVVTTDSQVEDVHFRRAWLSPYQIGWRAMAVNLSDIAAMSARPFGALAALTLPPTTQLAFFEGMLDGLCELGFRFGCPLLGGNLAQDPGRVTLTLTVFGSVPQGQAVYRSGAQPGDEIWVSGHLGGSAAGLRTFLQPIALPERTQAALRHRYAQPLPRIPEALFLRASGQLTSLIDLSDGLAGDLGHICEESGVGAQLVATAVPLTPGVREVAAARGDDPLMYALRGGEDFELCCTSRPGSMAPLLTAFQAEYGIELTRIGSITPERTLRLLHADGTETNISPQAYDHFQR